MNTEVQQYHNEIAATGRISEYADAISTAMAKGMKRSAAERRTLWQQIAEEATRCRDGIPMGTKARAPKQRSNGVTVLPDANKISRPTPPGIPAPE